MDNFFLVINILGLSLYLSLLPVHIALYEVDSKNGKTGFFKRGRFSTGILLIYLVFLSNSFGWDGFFGFADIAIGLQLIWLFWNFRSELYDVSIKGGGISSVKLVVYNAIGIITLAYQTILFILEH